MMCNDATMTLGVYLMGALDDVERAEVDAHLQSCESCRQELAELAALPSLLDRLTLDDFAVETPAMPPDLFERFAARAREDDERQAHDDLRSTSRRRYQLLTAVAAVVVLIAGATVGTIEVVRHAGHHATAPTAIGTANGIRMAVTLAAQTDGTSLQVKVAGLPEDEHCQLIAVSKSGTREVAGRWTATYSGQAWVTGSTAIPRAELSRLVLLGSSGKRLVTVTV